MRFNREVDSMFMLKKNGIYMFFACMNSDTKAFETVYLIEGGSLRRLMCNSHTELNYYYQSLEKYVSNVRQALNEYTEYQQKISTFIKRLGGSGNIHGCIIDIDKSMGFGSYAYCHLYINPYDGKITPYYAENKKARYVYKDLKSILKDQREIKLLQNYISLEKQGQLLDIQYGEEAQIKGKKTVAAAYDEGSYIYKLSKHIKALQYIAYKSIVRVWDEQILNYDFSGSAENIRALGDSEIMF